MHIAILGSGAVGGYYGARLARAGHRVTFVARGAHLRAIRERGLLDLVAARRLRRAAARPPTTRRPSGRVDVVVVAVKGYDNADGVRRPRRASSDRTRVVLTLQNGVESADELAARVGRDKVIGGPDLHRDRRFARPDSSTRPAPTAASSSAS